MSSRFVENVDLCHNIFDMKRLTFPQDFLWGSATAAHQVEGHNKNSDWWQWEHSEKRIAELRKQNKNPEDYFSGAACDSYNRYESDFDIAKNLHQNAHRLSIEWARIEPRQGQIDRQQLEHYRKVLEALRSRGIKTFVTLHHFTNPAWFAAKGGWERPGNIEYFLNYCEIAARELGGLMDFVAVINEPNFWASQAYLLKRFPPNKFNLPLYFKVRNNLIAAHNRAYKTIKAIIPDTPVGPVLAGSTIRLKGLPFLDEVLDSAAYKTVLRRVAQNSDFIGINYYWVHFFPKLDPKKYPRTAMGWSVYPQGLLDVLRELRKFSKPVYITENGIADAVDSMRRNFIKEHLHKMHQAIAEGADVRGYFHWSLLDNFEWDLSYFMRFGLVEIDPGHDLARKVRKSAEYYAEICKNNAMELEEAIA